MMDDVVAAMHVLYRDINRGRALRRYAQSFKKWQAQMREFTKEVHYTDFAFGELAKVLDKVDQTK